MSNGTSSNLWLVGILGIALLAVIFILGRCSVQPATILGPIQFKPGIPDTVYITVQPVTGTSSSDNTVYTADLDTVYCIVAMPEYSEATVHIDEPFLSGDIRATAYPYIENDTLKVENQIEYNIQPKPFEVTLHDTIPVPYPVPVEVPWIEHPATVATGVSIGWLAILIILL